MTYTSCNITDSVEFQACKASLLFTSSESFIFGLFGNLVAPLINRGAITLECKAANAYQEEAQYKRYSLNLLFIAILVAIIIYTVLVSHIKK